MRVVTLGLGTHASQNYSLKSRISSTGNILKPLTPVRPNTATANSDRPQAVKPQKRQTCFRDSPEMNDTGLILHTLLNGPVSNAATISTTTTNDDTRDNNLASSSLPKKNNGTKLMREVSLDEEDETEYNRSVLKRIKVCVDEEIIDQAGVDRDETGACAGLECDELMEESEDPLTTDMDSNSNANSLPIAQLDMSGNEPSCGKPYQQTVYSCTDADCPWFSRDVKRVQFHATKYHTIKYEFQCDMCTFSSSTNHLLRKHCESHANRSLRPETLVYQHKIIKCTDPQCPWKTITRSRFETHIMKCHTVRHEFRCDICSYSSEVDHLLRKHYESHAASHSGHNNANRSARPRLVHFVQPLQRVRVLKQKRYKCRSQNCPASYTDSKGMRRHMAARHSGHGVYRCPYCSFAVDMKRFYERHVAMHQNGLNYRPTATGTGTVTKHGGSHFAKDGSKTKGVKVPEVPVSTIKCKDSDCPHAYQRSYDLENHMKSHGQAFKHMCETCSFGSNRYVAVWKHKRLHKNTQTKLWSGTKSVKSFRVSNANYISAQKLIKRIKCGKGAKIASKELTQARIGNPKFTYQTETISVDGKHVDLVLRCLLCPASFNTSRKWKRHQCTAHRNETYLSAFKCPKCTYSSYEKSNVIRHIQTGTHNGNSPRKSPRQPIPNQRNVSKKLFIDNAAPTQTMEACKALKEPIMPPSESNGRDEPQISQSDNALKATAHGLISKVKIVNFKVIDERIVKLNSNLYETPGCTGKTTTIAAILIGLGYDILFDLTSLSELDLNDVVRVGETDGFIEVKLNLVSHKQLTAKYGPKLKIRREFQRGVSLHDSPIMITYGNVASKNTSRSELKTLISSLFPEFLWRIMVLNTENLQYLSDNFELCNNLFWEIAQEKKGKLALTTQQLKYQIEAFSKDIESRDQRISFLKESLKKIYQENAKLQKLQIVHAAELKSANEQYSFVKDVRQKLELQLSKSSSPTKVDHVSELLERMRTPFRKFLHEQHYVGDLLLGSKEDGTQELIAWVKDSQVQATSLTTEDARNTWKSMSSGKKKLATLGLYVSFWSVMDCCPVMFADAYSACQFEFSFPRAALPVLIDVIHDREDCPGQFFMSLP